MRLLNLTNAVKLLVLLVCMTIIIVLIAVLNKNSNNPETKVILYWNPFWKRQDYYIGTGNTPFKSCKYSNCYATYDRNFVPLEKYDALIMHGIHNKSQIEQPWTRKPHQMYVYMNIESPLFILPDLKAYSSYFNWTMSYRYDSDLVLRYGVVRQQVTDYVLPSIKSKTKLAAWFVSNCETSSKRETLVDDIQKHMPVDIYGECGKLSCMRSKASPKLSSTECYEMLEEKYKFYFSFENSYCKDYATEKMYYILNRNIVPVVYGGGDYDLMAPPHSVINVADYANVTQLVDYLQYLNRNDDEYLKYFEWKKQYVIDYSKIGCDLCEKLSRPVIKKSIYEDLHTWWWGPERSYCKVGKNLPAIVSNLLKT